MESVPHDQKPNSGQNSEPSLVRAKSRRSNCTFPPTKRGSAALPTSLAMVRMAQQQEGGEFFSGGDMGAGGSFLGDLSHKRGNESGSRVADSDEKGSGHGPSDRHQPAPAGGEDGADVDDDVAMTFPQRLMEVLDDPENADVLSWLPHGRGFVIYRKKAFEQRLLPKCFGKQSKYSSFTRKLNRWGFSRVTRGPEAGAYYHQFFQRGGHRLVMQMSCQSTTKGAANESVLQKGTTSGLASISNPPFSAAMPGIRPAALPNFALSTLALEQIGLPQQQQQFLQLQLQQHLLQQEAMFRTLLASSPSMAGGMQTIHSGIAPLSMHSLSQQQDHAYSQFLASQLSQRDHGVAIPSTTNSGSSQILFSGGDAEARREGIDSESLSQGLDEGGEGHTAPQPPPT